jgi:hypothetical protein
MRFLRRTLMTIALLATSSCGIFYHPKLAIGKEPHWEFLERLSKSHGNEHTFYFLSSNRSLVKFDKSVIEMREQVRNYAISEIKMSGVCVGEPIIDIVGSWFNERGDIYINFYCS